MELKVWVEGIQRIVCGVTVNTTCQDVVFALAHATGKVGRFTLIERWRNNERLLAPNENPLKLLLKWGEYANDVQFILQRSENKTTQQQQQETNNNNNSNNLSKKSDKNFSITTNTTSSINTTTTTTLKTPLGINNSNNNHNNIRSNLHSNEQNKLKDIKNQFGHTQNENNIGIVRGIPKEEHAIQQSPQKSTNKDLPLFIPKHEKSHSNPVEMTNSNSFKFYATESGITGNNNNNSASTTGAYNDMKNKNKSNNLYNQLGAHNSRSINDINLSEVRNAFDEKAFNAGGSSELLFSSNKSNTSNENMLDLYNGNIKAYTDATDQYKNAPTISSNGALVPPPYRNPPPPRNSPQAIQQQQEQNKNNNFNKTNNDFDFELSQSLNNFINYNNNNNNNNHKNMEESESIFQASHYNELLQLIKLQREKISAQQLEISKYDAEIIYLENKDRDQAKELEAISLEITKADQIFRQGSEQLQTLQYVEEENELVKQQEKTLKSEIALLRSKLANCETELLQCKNKVHMLLDDIEVEQRAITNKQKHNR